MSPANQPTFDLEAVIKRRGFIWRSFDIYGGSAGFYDYGPLGTALRNNIVSVWRNYFVNQEGFAEIDTPNLTPHEVFKASGHLDKFTDLILECTTCDASFKADSMFSESYSEIAREITIEALRPEELETLILEKGVVCPDCQGNFKTPYEFNLMFKTTVGRDRTAYLQPETAQGIFVNFQNLYAFHREKLPFGAVQLGKGFRNEISPRQGLIRLREFNMAEAEVFIDPEVNDYPGFDNVKDLDFTLLDQHGAFHYCTTEEAVTDGIVCHRALAYFMGVTQHFLLDIGVDSEKLRFRQHQKDEMAHYAEDCWDAEILMEINSKESWIECVGIANRSCFDLEQHMVATGSDLRAYKPYAEPIEREVERLKPNLSVIGRNFRQDAKIVQNHLASLTPPFPDRLEIDINGELKEITPDMYTVERATEKINGIRFLPAVIEPSFGIDRILYALLQHSFNVGKARDGVDSENYNLLRLKRSVAPVKVAIFPLFNRAGMTDLALGIKASLRDSGIPSQYDESGSIGKRYARMDEIGTPYCITVDHQSLEDGTVTIRDRDSTQQHRIPVDSITEIVEGLLSAPSAVDAFGRLSE